MPAFCPSCGQKLVSAPPRPDFCPHCQKESQERSGWQFGDYEILGRIAQGGMGVVYCALQISANRRVALKMLRSGQQASADERERFRTEARAASHLDHPNIVPIYEVGEHNGEPFFSMRLLEGNLASLIEDWGAADHRTQDDRAALIAKLARAVHHAHSRGVLHRDIKPTNVLIDQHGEPHLGDFGLARITEKGRDFTQSHAIAGTPSYMAPEQASGPTKNLTTAADIYSLGAIFYHLLVGRAPFVGSTKEVLDQLAHAQPEPIRQRNPLIDRDLETICLKCLAKNPRERYRSAEDLAEDIERWFRRHPIHARPTGFPERILKWSRRNPVAAALSASAAFLLLAALAAVLLTWQRAESAADENRNRLVRFNIASGLRNWEDGDLFSAALWFIEGLRLDRGKDELSHRFRLASIFNDGPTLLQMYFPDGPVHNAAFNPDGTSIVAASGTNSIHIWRADGSDAAAAMHHDGGEKPYAAFSPDGRMILSRNGNSARVWSLGGEPLATLDHPNITHAVFSGDSKQIATADASGAVILWNASGKMLHQFRGPTVIASLAFSKNKNHLLVAGRNGTVTIYQGADPVVSWRARDDLRFAAFDDAATKVVTAHSNGEARVWDAATGAALSPVMRESSWITHAAFSPNGNVVALSTGGHITRLRNSATGDAIAELTGHKNVVVASEFSPDGARILTHSFDGTVRIFETATGHPIAPIFWHGGIVTAATFNAAGERLLTASSDGAIRLWSLKKNDKTVPQFGKNARIISSFRGGEIIAAQTSDHFIQIWDTKTWKPLSAPITNSAPLTGGWIASDHRQFLSVEPTDSKLNLRRWELSSGRELPPVIFESQRPETLLPSPNGKRCVLYNGKRVEVFELTGGKSLFKSGQTARFAVFSPNARYLLFGNSESAEILDTGTDEILFPPLRDNGTFSGGEFSADSSTFLLHGATTQVFDTLSGRRIGPPHNAVDAHFSPHGQSIVTAGADGIVRLWETSSGKALTPPMRHDAAVNLTTFSSDGHWIATVSEDRTARVWDAVSGEPVTFPFPLDAPVEQISFAGSSFLITENSNGQKIWPLSIDRRSFKQLTALTQVMASHQIDSTGSFTPLDAASLEAAWRTAHGAQ